MWKSTAVLLSCLTLLGSVSATWALNPHAETPALPAPVSGGTSPNPLSTAGAPNLYGTIGNHLVRIDPATGAVVEDIGTTPAFSTIQGLTYDAATEALYGVVDVVSNPKLATFDRSTGAATVVGEIDLVSPASQAIVAESLAFNPADGQLHAAINVEGSPLLSNSRILATVERTTGAATEVAPFAGLAVLAESDADAMEFVDGALFASNTEVPQSFLFTVDPTTAAATLVGEVGFNHLSDLAYDASTKTLFGTAHTSRVLIRIDTVTGQGSVVGPTHGPSDFGGATLTSIAFAPGPTPPVRIDIKPGSFPNSINLRNKGVIPVAVLSEPGFDATAIDVTHLVFGPGGAREAHGRGHVGDVDGDGDLDLVLHFRTSETGILSTDTEACLEGILPTGQIFAACDSVRIVP